MGVRLVRFAGRCAGVAVALAASGAAYGQSVRTGVTVSGGASAETNPYNEVGSSGVAVAATASVVPRLQYRTETTTFDLAGSAQFRQFVDRYGLEDNYGVNSAITSRQSEQVTLRANAGYSYTEGGFGGFGRPVLSAAAPILPTPDVVLPAPILIPTDVTILGRRTRVSAFNANAGIDARVTERTQVSADVGGRTMRFADSRQLSDFNNVNAQLRVSRSLNERTSVGVVGGYSKSDFLNTRIGDSDTYSALLSMDTRVGSRWTVSGSAGLARTTLQQAAGQPDVRFNSLTATLRACGRWEYSTFCVNGQRSPQPAANGDVRITDTIGVDYSRRLSPQGQFSVGGNYARTGRGRVVAPQLQPAIDFASAFARYDHRLAENMTLFTSASYSRIFDSIRSRRANAGVAAGIQVALGALK